ncbi:MAG: hypothetical protein KIS83_07780 [Rubrivivax sp.]|nr:hypothetical protein [Rubrivivax sp.]
MSDEPFSFEEHMRRQIQFPDPWLRIEGMRTARRAVEEQLVFLRNQRAVQLQAQLARVGSKLHPIDAEDKVDEYRKVVNELFPKVMRGGFVISLWSVFESAVKNLAEYVRSQKNLPFGLQELRAGDFLEQTDVFFKRVVNVDAFPKKDVRAKLDRLKGLRNTLAHHDGSAVELPKPLRCNSAEEYAAQGLLLCDDLHHKYIVPTEDYAAEAMELVATHLQDFAERLYKAIHPVPLRDDA